MRPRKHERHQEQGLCADGDEEDKVRPHPVDEHAGRDIAEHRADPIGLRGRHGAGLSAFDPGDGERHAGDGKGSEH
jgi:hypothetical protein